MKRARLVIRIDETRKANLEEIAKRRGLASLTDAVEEALTLWAGFDDEFLSRIDNFVVKLRATRAEVLQQAGYAWIAEKVAHREVDGRVPFREFRWEGSVDESGHPTERDLITGERFFEEEKQRRIHDLKVIRRETKRKMAELLERKKQRSPDEEAFLKAFLDGEVDS